MKHYIRNSINTGLGFALVGFVLGFATPAATDGLGSALIASAALAAIGFALGPVAYTLTRSIRWIYSA